MGTLVPGVSRLGPLGSPAPLGPPRADLGALGTCGWQFPMGWMLGVGRGRGLLPS